MSELEIIGRASWGFRQTRSPGSAPVARQGAVLHHTVTPEWRGINAFRRLNELMIRMGYVCVGYNIMVTVDGLIGAGRPLNQVGGHTRGYNTTRHAITLIGNFSNKRPPDAMEEAVIWVYRHGIERGWWSPSLVGHRDLGSTACPGGSAYARLPAYRSGRVVERTWFDMASKSDLESVVRSVVRSERSAIAAEAVEQLLSWRRSPEHRSLGSWLYSGGVRLDELENPHPNDLPVIVSRIEDRLKEPPPESTVRSADTVVVAANDVDEGYARVLAASIGAQVQRWEGTPIEVETVILVGAAGNLSGEIVGAEKIVRLQGADREETAAKVAEYISG